ncbi:MAG: hypothetical protein FWE27_06015 [Defluviitaleaceae bacterium]|nr:hypothetical protein [Defluviitaleaceae bacterium]
MNLLPEWAQKAKARKSLIKNLAFAQTAIFLLLITGIFLLNAWEKQIRNHHSELSKKLSAFDTAPSEMAAELQSARTQATYIEEFLSEILPAAFDVNSLDFIQSATPENTSLTRINYEHQELLIVSRTNDLNNAETHRANLSQFFSYVYVGRITRTDDDYTYEMRIPIDE